MVGRPIFQVRLNLGVHEEDVCFREIVLLVTVLPGRRKVSLGRQEMLTQRGQSRPQSLESPGLGHPFLYSARSILGMCTAIPRSLSARPQREKRADVASMLFVVVSSDLRNTELRAHKS